MTVVVAPGTRLRREIWSSLVTVLRSYTALHAEIAIRVRTIGGLDIALLESKHAEVELNFRATRGSGMWHLKKSGVKESGSFVIQEDGALNWSGKPMELDMAAMDLVERLIAQEHRAEGEQAE